MRNIFLITLLVISSLTVMAQDSLYIYKANKTFSSYAISSIDSMSFTKPIVPSNIQLDSTHLNLIKNQTYTFSLKITPTNAYNKSVLWTSSNENIVTVIDGKATALSVGTATIRAQCGAISTDCVIDVTVPVDSIKLNPATLNLSIQKEYTLTASIFPADATNKTIIWSSSDENIATVVDGKIQTIKAGTVSITAKINSKLASCFVTVYDSGVVINGVRWATRNVADPGVFANNSEDAGMFYQWNRKKAWATTGTVKSWNVLSPTTSIWEDVNDPSPTGWRIPTLAEIQSLVDQTKVTNEWTTQNGVNGRRFTDRITGANIFLPAFGWRDDKGVLIHSDLDGRYWSSTRNTTAYVTYDIFFSKDNAAYWIDNLYDQGDFIRPVIK